MKIVRLLSLMIIYLSFAAIVHLPGSAYACGFPNMRAGTVNVTVLRFGRAGGYSDIDDIKFPALAVANLTGFQVNASQGDTCVAAVDIDPLLQIVSVSFLDDRGELVPFSEFVFDPAMKRELGRNFRAFKATALSDIDLKGVEMEIKVAVKTNRSRKPRTLTPRALTRTNVANFFAESRVATGASDGASSVGEHFSLLNPLAVDLCLGPEDPDTGLSTCPALPGELVK